MGGKWHRRRITACTLITLTALSAVNAQTNPYRLQLSGEADYHLVTTYLPKPARKASTTTVSPVLASKPYASQIEAAARQHDLDPALVHAVIHVESRHQMSAVSPKGAVGLMQVLPETAERFGIRQAHKPEQNLAAGTRYLRTLLDQFDQRLDLALAAYNAGEGAVIKYKHHIPPYRETRDYVPAVMERYDAWRVQPNLSTSITYLPGTRLEIPER